MKNILSILIIGVFAAYFIQRSLFDTLLNNLVHVSQFLLLFYVIWILFYDFFRSLKKKLGEKFGIHLKRFKRKIYKLKR
jgi:hypothetical protein